VCAEMFYLSALHSEFVVDLHGFMIDPPCVYMVMELCQSDLFSYLHEPSSNLKLADRLDLAYQASCALAYVHTLGIVQRDVK
jgi:serine/threonine protein kinase